MSIKTTLTNPPTIALIALQIIGGLLILASIVGFRSGGMLWPMLGSGGRNRVGYLGVGTHREKLAALRRPREPRRARRTRSKRNPPRKNPKLHGVLHDAGLYR